jgi:pimeloyl-ACP methyl ester carboxylesterase
VIQTKRVRLANGIAVEIADQGDRSGPGVVMLPGPTDSWRSYAGVLERLPTTLRAVAVSQRGHGDSDKPAAGFGIADFAADAVLLLDALGIEHAVLVGHSGSCLTVRRVALDRPDRVAGLVLEASPSSLCGDRLLTEFVASILSTLTDPIDPNWARSMITSTSSPVLDPDVVDEMATELMKVPARAWREMFGAILRYDDRYELSRITAPTWLLWGDADAVVPGDMQAELAERIPDAERVTYPGLGHTPRWEDPGRFAADLVAFVGARSH